MNLDTDMDKHMDMDTDPDRDTNIAMDTDMGMDTNIDMDTDIGQERGHGHEKKIVSMHIRGTLSSLSSHEKYLVIIAKRFS
jgi:hypothetical protein